MTELRFDMARAKRYRKRGYVHAYAVPNSATYFPAWSLPDGQSFDGSHMVLVNFDPDTRTPLEVYGCALVEFHNTYDRVFGADRWVWRKDAIVQAYQLDVAGTVVTDTSQGVEVRGKADVGDWIVRNPNGDVYTWPARSARLYEEVVE